jgi:amino acid adenylation domain-containing protein
LIDRLTPIWAAVLEQADCPTQATFMDLGGDSISATQIVARVREATGIDFPLDTMFDGMTIERMAAWLDQARATAQGQPTLPPIARQSRASPLPLSHSQRRMWLVQSFASDTTGYNVTFALRLEGPLDAATLQNAVDTVFSRHDTFRTRFVMTPEGPHQVIDGASTLQTALDAIDLSSQPPDHREQAASEVLNGAASMPFNLTHESPWRLVFVKVHEEAHILAWVAHHILVDLWANLNIARELAQVYNHQLRGQPLQLPEVVLDCADHGSWQISEAVQAHLAPQLEYWRHQLQDLPPTNLPLDYPMADGWYKSARRVVVPVPAPLRTRLLAQASNSGHTPFMIMLAGLSVLLGRQGRSNDVAVVTPIANRQHSQTEHIVASLTNTLVMRTHLSDALTFLELLDQIKQTTLSAYAHQDLPFDQLVEQLASQKRLHDLPLGLQVMLNVANAPTDGIRFDGLHTQRVLLDRGAPQFPMSLGVDLEMTHTVVLEYADTLFRPETAQAFVTHFLQVLERALGNPTQRISELHWLSPESQAALAQWNGTRQPIPAHDSLEDMLRAQCAKTPQAVACTFSGQQLSYLALQQQAETLAAQLQSRGIGRGQRVGIHLSRGITPLTCVRAVLMTGAAYVPLDPRFPDERLRDMSQDAGLSLILSETWQNPAHWAAPPCLDPKDLLVTDKHQPFAPLTPPTPDDPAYVIYTSGSTGRPKGVVVPHRTVLNFLRSMAQTPGLAPSDKLLAVTTLSFDIAVLELLLPLSVGAQVILASDDEIMDGQALQRLIARHEATAMQATPAAWRALLDAGWSGRQPFKALIGGEALSLDLASRLLPRCSELWNMYGPTETTVWSTCWRVRAPELGIYIGRPIANTRVRIVDQTGHECPIGTPGEIVIEGDGVATGYWQRDDLTAERFIPDATSPRMAAYKTGDLGRWLWSGQLEHLGRLDHQIKVRGYRIEPGDIEAALLRHADVAHCVVIAREDQPDDVRLVAYVVRRGDATSATNPGTWREHLRQSLPDYMVPQHFITLAEMPLLANGKLNRHALPMPHRQATPSPSASPASLTPWEARVAATWCELLGMPEVSSQDNFFDLGGHSLLAMRAISQIADATGVKVNPRAYIFETLAQLAVSYERAEAAPEESASLAPQAGKRSLLDRLLRRS